MRKIVLIISIVVAALSNTVQAENATTLSYSPNSISQAMDFAIKSNSLTYVYAQEPGRIDSIYKAYTRPDSLKLKNPNTALFYAMVPGFVVHGTGHFYAGKPVTGVALLGVEIISLGLCYASAMFSFAEAMGGTGKGDPEVTGLIGLGLFLSSWIYDMAGAPAVIERENEKILEKRATGLSFKF